MVKLDSVSIIHLQAAFINLLQSVMFPKKLHYVILGKKLYHYINQIKS